MHEFSNPPRLAYNEKAFDEIFDLLGLRTDAQKARFLGIAESSFNRIRRGVCVPGGQFVANALHAVNSDPRLNQLPAERIRFDRLFSVAVRRR
ncbi:MAG: hypothetical protein HOV79_13020 [Hamadaea sp.]|nr:hypothetical protein [Hamadaea sp.]